MHYRHSYRRFDNNLGEPFFDEFEGGQWHDGAGHGPGTFFTWMNSDYTLLHVLPWLGGVALAIGILILLFPMLLVIAVAALFIAVGVACLSMWWQLRQQSRPYRVSAGTPWWERLRAWIYERLN